MGFSLRDRIAFGRAMFEGKIQFERELRDNRAAGIITNSTQIPESNIDNTVPQTGCESSSNSKKKAEQQRRAEAQAPEEEPGAERVETTNPTDNSVGATEAQASQESGTESVETTANPINDAAKSGGMQRIDDDDPNVMKFDDFGVTIDLRNDPTSPVATSTPPVQNAMNGNYYPFNPIAYQAQVAGFNGTNGYMNNTPQPKNNGMHKVDQPKKPKQIVVKAEPDNVNVSIPDITDGMDVYPYTPPKEPEVIASKIDKPDTAPVEPPVPLFDNTMFFEKYNFLKDIERIALENNMQIRIIERPVTKFLDVYVCSPNGTAISNKGFAIDMGNVIDHRKKIFPGIQHFYEGCQAYPLFIPSGNTKDGKKAPNVLNVDLIKGLIVGGNDYPDIKQGMYTEDFRELNKYVALITIPTKDITPQNRKAIQNRLIALYKHGVFNTMCKRDRGSRFIITNYNKDNGTFVLSNKGVPKNYGGPVVSKEIITIDISDKNAVAHYSGQPQ